MDLIDRLRRISDRIPKIIDRLKTEEATKNALIMPWLQALGYDVFDPEQVEPEYTADVGIKQGEKVDYAILRNDKPIMLIECKKVGTELADKHASQLYRYFSVAEARFALLTNGIEYRFYADLDEENKMDSAPFFIFDMSNLTQTSVKKLKQFCRDVFDAEMLLTAAEEMRYSKHIVAIFEQELKEPSEQFVRFFVKEMSEGRIRITQSVINRFSLLIKRSLNQHISDRISARLSQALEGEQAAKKAVVEEVEAAVEEQLKDDGIVTTEEEIEGYHIVKAILSKSVDSSRVIMRDTKSYCGVLLDDSNRKTICRLLFNNIDNKYLVLFDDERNQLKYPISALKDIYTHAEAIRDRVRFFDGKREQANADPSPSVL